MSPSGKYPKSSFQKKKTGEPREEEKLQLHVLRDVIPRSGSTSRDHRTIANNRTRSKSFRSHLHFMFRTLGGVPRDRSFRLPPTVFSICSVQRLYIYIPFFIVPGTMSLRSGGGAGSLENIRFAKRLTKVPELTSAALPSLLRFRFVWL